MKRVLATILLLSLYLPANGAVIWVSDLSDDTNSSNGTCNLREAIQAAESDSEVDACTAGLGDDEIYFELTGTINLLVALPSITKNLNIIGPGVDFLTLDANGFGRVLNYSTGSSLRSFLLAGMTITDGSTPLDGGGISFSTTNVHTVLEISDCKISGNEANNGGGIKQLGGDLILKQVSVSENTASGAGGIGGGIFANGTGTITIENSTISGNTSDGAGGGIRSDIVTTIKRSTISGNGTKSSGGGISWGDSVELITLDIRHSTITNNSAATDFNLGDEGGLDITSDGSFLVKNTIIAGNFDLDPTPLDRPDIGIPNITTVTSLGYNFIGINTGATQADKFPGGNPNVNDDYVGTSALPLVANLNPLAENLGPTLTHSTGSTAFELVDQGSCSEEAFDQRGFGSNITPGYRPRDLGTANADDGCDIGAYEAAGLQIEIDPDFKVLLDGPYDNVLMNTDLNSGGHLPTNQPYNVSPWNYGGLETANPIPSDMVDWVIVRFVTGGIKDPSFPNIERKAGFILENNGDLTAPDDLFPLRSIPGHFFVAVDHRNHLEVISALPIRYEFGESMTHDFRTDGSAYTSGGLAMRDRGALNTMWAGDGDKSADVTAFDFLNVWLPANGGAPGYSLADFNMDGSATSFDFLQAWLPANGQASQVP